MSLPIKLVHKVANSKCEGVLFHNSSEEVLAIAALVKYFYGRMGRVETGYDPQTGKGIITGTVDGKELFKATIGEWVIKRGERTYFSTSDENVKKNYTILS